MYLYNIIAENLLCNKTCNNCHYKMKIWGCNKYYPYGVELSKFNSCEYWTKKTDEPILKSVFHNKSFVHLHISVI